MDKKITFRVHAIQRMFERSIDDADVLHVLETGEIIEDYKDDFPYPSRLMLGFCGQRPLHVVVAENASEKELIVVTVYEPALNQWDNSFKRRIL